MLKTHHKSLGFVLILGTLSPFQPLSGQNYEIPKNEYYLIIDRDDMDDVINNTQQLNFTTCEGPFTEVEEIKKQFARSLAGPAEIKEDEEMAADIANESFDGTVPLPSIESTSQPMKLLKNIKKPMSFSSEIPVTDLDIIREQLVRHWNIPANMKENEGAPVDIKVEMNPDATVRSATVVETNPSTKDPLRKRFINSALEAVHKVGPLNLPLNRYDKWKTILIRFDPQPIL